MRLRTKLGASLATMAVVLAAAVAAIGASGAAGAATAGTSGTWGSVQDIPGLAALVRIPGGLKPSSLSALGCSTLGNCVAVGDYSPPSGTAALFVATEVNGTWGDAQPLAGLPAVATGSTPSFASVSCGPPDFCTAVGTYDDTGNSPQAFAVTETGGTWATPATLDASGLGSAESIGLGDLSCPAAGECTLIGSYTPGTTGAMPAPLTADESGGAWRALRPLAGVPGLPHSSAVTESGLTSLSCGAPGDCTAGGSYQYATVQQPFLVSESGHSWGDPQPVPGIATVGSSGPGDNSLENLVTSVSCPDASDCAVAGTYFPQPNSAGLFFTLDEAAGAWGQAKALGIPSADSVNAASTAFVSCRSAGNCVIAATAANDPGAPSSEVVTATESGGAWGAATAVRGIQAGDKGYATGLACVPAGDCTLLGVRTPAGHVPYDVFSAASTDGGAMGTARQLAISGDNQPLVPKLACPANGHCTVTYNGATPAGPLHVHRDQLAAHGDRGERFHGHADHVRAEGDLRRRAGRDPHRHGVLPGRWHADRDRHRDQPGCRHRLHDHPRERPGYLQAHADAASRGHRVAGGEVRR